MGKGDHNPALEDFIKGCMAFFTLKIFNLLEYTFLKSML